MRFSQEYIDRLQETAEFGYGFFLKLLPVTIGIIVAFTGCCALLGFSGFLTHQNVVSITILAGVIIFFALIPMWFLAWYKMRTITWRYEIHNWSYDRYGSGGLWYKINDGALHRIPKYLLLQVLILAIFYCLLYLVFKT